MKLPKLSSLRRSLSPQSRAGFGAAFALLALVTAVEVTDGPQPKHLGLLASAPFLAAAFASWPEVTIVGAAAFGIGLTFAVTDPDGLSSASVINLIGIVVSAAIAAAVGVIRQRQSQRLADLAKLASVAQAAVLRPITPQIGPLSVAGRYISASALADIGGDLYEVLDTPYGTRTLIGDVRGKGLDAVRVASVVLGSYRHVAYERADLRAIVTDLDKVVARSVGDEDFVTAALVEERGGTLTIVNCGHPSPLLLRRGTVISMDPPVTSPPLGFNPAVRPRVERLEPGDRLLLYTDGLAEARNNGEFFPIAERAWGLLGHGTVADGLASLETALVEWVQSRLDDDIALVLMEYAGNQVQPPTGVPSWEVGGFNHSN
jgi:sigma-B regulation protein RsbU (phosphoserine phosphatase)